MLSSLLDAAADLRPLTVVVAQSANPEKIGALRQHGCAVHVCSGDNEARDARARELAESIGGTYCSSHDDLAVIEGQAGVVREVLVDRPAAQRIYVPVGGGGLLAGSILAAQRRPDVEIIGVEPSGAESMHRSLAAGRRVHLDRIDTICDALRAPAPGALCLDIVRRRAARVIVVDDEHVIAAQKDLSARVGPVEPSAAVSVAGALSAQDDDAVCIVTGGPIL